jgi:hypothetical protein
MPAIGTKRAPGIALAVARPPEGLTSRSTVPWTTTVGTSSPRSFSVRSPEAMIAASWRPDPAGLRPRSNERRAIRRRSSSSRSKPLEPITR